MKDWPPDLKDLPETQVYAAIPGRDAISARLRIAFLKTLHAAQCTDAELTMFARWYSLALEEPPWSLFWYGPTAATELANRLRSLASQLDQAAAATDAVKRFVLSSTDSEGANGTRVPFKIRFAQAVENSTDNRGNPPEGDPTITPF